MAGLAVATIAGATWFTLSTADDNATTAPVEAPVPSTGLDIAPQDVSSPLIAPIDDASEVMEEIDDNSSEAEALDLLGLDDLGNQVAAGQPLGGYRYSWSYGPEATTTVTVDATTDSYVLTTGDGFEIRHIDGRSYSTSDGSTWTESVDLETPTPMSQLGVDEPIRLEQLLDPLALGYTVVTTSELDDGATSIAAEVDAFGYSQAHPTEYAEFMASLGHPVGTEAVQPGDIVVIQATLGVDSSTVDMMTVETSTYVTSYSLDEVFDTAPVIETPAV